MSAREQARRDAEFDRLTRALLNEVGGGIDTYTEAAIVGTLRVAYEMGKRHGREEIEVKVAYSHSLMPRDIDHVRADEVKP